VRDEMPGTDSARRASRLRLFAILLGALAMLRIAATLTTFSETADEPMHLTAGLQILSEGRYDMQLQNPPLPRLLIALPPWLAGARYDSARDGWPEILGKFHSLEHYKTMLVYARSGTIVFFLTATMALWFWARRETDSSTALLAVLLFTTQPVILGHSGLATLDVAGIAGLGVALLAFSRWVDQPSLARTVIFALACGFAILCKLLSIAYVPLACAGYLAARLLHERELRQRWRSLTRLLIVPPVALVVVWAGYGFSIGRVGKSPPLPAPRFFEGISQMIAVNDQGFPSYLFGSTSLEGWWWYFPATLALKSTIGFLVLVAAACLGLTVARIRPALSRAALPALAMLAFAMTSSVDIGVRYVLPVYLPLSLFAAIALREMLQTRSRWRLQPLAAILLAWHLLASVLAHPDYMAYFNETAGRDPSRYLIDSNLDWGQDVLRLRDTVRELKIESLSVSLLGPGNLDLLGFPPHVEANPWIRTTGWLAVSDHSYRMSQAGQGGWAWLANQPYRRVGKSIRLYNLR
jgi:hypothetical protein